MGSAVASSPTSSSMFLMSMERSAISFSSVVYMSAGYESGAGESHISGWACRS